MLKEKIAKCSRWVKKCHFASDPCSERRLSHFPGFKIVSQKQRINSQNFSFSIVIIYWFSGVFQRISVEKLSATLVADLSNYNLVNQPSFRHISLATFTILLVHLLYSPIKGSKFILFICCFFLAFYSHYRFAFRISKNKSLLFVFLDISQVLFYSNLSFLYLAMNHSYPFSAVLNRSATFRQSKVNVILEF